MSALIYVVTEESISVYTDTLVVNELGEELGHTSKALYLPHLNAIICGTGIAGLGDELFLQANASPLKNLVDLTRLAGELLPRIWMEDFNLSGVDSTHISSTVYLFGFDSDSNSPLVFAHRSTNGFKSEQIAKVLPTTGLKPTDGFDEVLQVESDDDATYTMLRQMMGQATLPEDRRVYIGGDMLKFQLMPYGLIANKTINLDEMMERFQGRL